MAVISISYAGTSRIRFSGFHLSPSSVGTPTKNLPLSLGTSPTTVHAVNGCWRFSEHVGRL